MIKENGDKLQEEDKKKLEEAIEKAKKDIESEDIEVVKKAIDELTNVSNGIVSKMYSSANPNGADAGETGANGNNGSNGDNGDNGAGPEVVVDDDNK